MDEDLSFTLKRKRRRVQKVEGILEILAEPEKYVSEDFAAKPEPAFDAATKSAHCQNFLSEYPQGCRLLDYETLIEKAFANVPTGAEGPLVGECETSTNNIQTLEREEIAELANKVTSHAISDILLTNKKISFKEEYNYDHFFEQMKSNNLFANVLRMG